jgi:hypothetical protein
VYEGIINSKIKIKIPNNWGIAQKNLKKSPPTLLGKQGTFEKEIIKLITLGRND